MLKLILAGIVGLIIIIALIIIIRNKPDLWFWIFLNLFFDPGGYVVGLLDGALVGSLNIADVFIAGITICLIFAKVNWKSIFQDKFLVRFLFYLLIFSAYFFIMYGGVVPYLHNDFDYPTFLIKNRYFVYGLIILISVYVFSLRGLYYFYTTTLSVGIICLTLFFISLVTGANLIPVTEMSRYKGDAMMRISMESYGMFYLLFPVALTTFILSRKIHLNLKYKNWLYYSGVIMMITLLITLTRRTQIDIVVTVIIIIFIISYLFRTGKLSEMFKIVIPAIVIILVLSLTFPKYINYIATIGEDTFLLIATGKDSRGEGDNRVSGVGEMEITKEYIRNNLLFGTGYTYLYWGPGYATSLRGATFSIAADAAGEVPIYYLLFGFGIAGAILMAPLYYFMVKLFFYLARLLKLTLINYLHDPLTIIFSIYILLFIAAKFTSKLYTLGSDFTGAGMSGTAFLMGIGFALYRKLYLNIYKELQ